MTLADGKLREQTHEDIPMQKENCVNKPVVRKGTYFKKVTREAHESLPPRGEFRATLLHNMNWQLCQKRLKKAVKKKKCISQLIKIQCLSFYTFLLNLNY